MALIIGTADSEWIDGTAADDTIQGLAGDDTLVGYQGNDLLEGGEGNDVLSGGPGNDTLDGGAGIDTAAYTSTPGAVSVDLAAGTASGAAGNDVLISIENIIGSAFNDTLIGDSGANLIRGLEGDDVLGARGGADTLDGGAGFDYVSVTQAAAGVEVDLAAGSYGFLGAPTGVTLISIEGVYGSAYADLLRGDGNLNILRGNGGDDTLDGGAGFDYADYATAAGPVQVHLAAGTATGADGNDTLISIEGVRGSNHDDLLVGDGGANIFRGRGGNDTLDGGAGIDTADYRGSGSSGVVVDLSQGIATGGAGDDTLISIENVIGSEFDDLIIGDDGPNSLVGGLGNDVLRAGRGADTLQGEAGDDTLDGGDNDHWFQLDLVSYSYLVGDAAGVVVDLGAGTAVASDGNDTLIGIEGVIGTSGDDLLIGGSAYLNYFYGGGGNDTIVGGAHFDIVDYSGAGGPIVVDLSLVDDQASGPFGIDQLRGIELVYGSHFDDLLVGGPEDTVLRGNRGDDTLRGGEGADVADYGSSASAVTVDLAAGTAAGGDGNDTLESIEGVYGSAFDDTLHGDAGDNFFRGGRGNDTIDGREGHDTVSFATALGAVTVDLAAGTASGADGSDTLISIESVVGSNFSDLLIGDARANRLEGDDLRFDGAGNDTLRGGDGDDTLAGGGGDDLLDGGDGLDVAEYRGTIEAFSVSIDQHGVVSIIDETGSEGSDLLVGVERAVFADGAALAFDIDGAGGIAYRMYGVLDRAPDLPGLGYWIAQLDEGASVLDMSVGFLGSAEFQALYGTNPTNEEYTQALYRNVLDRDPDADGYAYWIAVLDGQQWNGAYYGQTTRAQMLVDFAESTENQDSVLPLIESGIRFELWEG